MCLGPGDWCRDGWIGGYGKRCYKIMSTPSTWSQASSICKELGGTLVVLNDERTTAFVVGFLTQSKFLSFRNKRFTITELRMSKCMLMSDDSL